MRNLLLCSCLSLLSVSSVYAEINEGFEGETFPSEGWSVSPTPVTGINSPSMKVVTYASVSDFSSYIFGYSHGGNNVLQSTSGGFGSVSATKAAVPSNNWLITPQLSVGNSDHLNFMIAANAAFNGGTGKGDFRFDVLVSTTTADSASFIDTIYSVKPISIMSWQSVTLDLSNYVGQNIYLAFYDHGTYYANSFVKNNIYLDDIKIIDGDRCDLSITEISSPSLGCDVHQPLTATIINAGSRVDSFDLCCRMSNGNLIKETITQPLSEGERLIVTMKEPLELTAGATESLSVWVENPSLVDANMDNDTTNVSVKIGEEAAYPFETTDETIGAAFTPSTSYSSGGWQFSVDDKAWQYVKYRVAKNYLLETQCVNVPTGTMRVSFEYTADVASTISVKLGKFIVANYKEIGKTEELAVTSDWTEYSFNVNIEEGGLYSLGLIPSITATSGEINIRNISFSDPYEDVKAESIVSPMAAARLLNSDLEVSALFKNIGANDMYDVPVYYQVGNGAIVTGKIDCLPLDSAVVYTFADAFAMTTLGETNLKVWSAMAGDGDLTNDTVLQTLYVYEAKSFPYVTGFEDEDDYYSWSPINLDADNVYWGIISASATSPVIADTHSAYINSYSGVEHNDWMISPAIAMPAGKARVSFYYMTYYTTGVTNMKVYLGTSAEPEAMSTLLTTVTIDNQLTPLMGSAYIDIPVAGNYYIGFYDEGLGRDIILDNIHVDAGEDVIALGSYFKEETGFDLTKAPVLFALANRGMSDLTNIPVSYRVNGGASVLDTVPSLAAGDTVVFTFSTLADVSTPGASYAVIATAAYADDIDTFNNQVISDSLYNYASKSIPCTQTFADAVECKYWKLEGNWVNGTNCTSSNAAYDDTGALRHTNAAVNEGGDWAYSACMNIEAGTYELSYFYRTYLNMATNPYLCNFEVYLGSACTPEAMTMLVDEQVDVTVSVKQYKKIIKSITIPETGKYYIGVCYKGTASSAVLFMDCFSIAEPDTTGLSLPYEADFSQDDWYHYNTATSHFEQWSIAATGEGTSYVTTKLTSAASYASKIAAGILRSPAFKLAAGQTVHAEFDYSIVNGTANDTAHQSITLLMADVDTPDNYTTIVAQGTENSGLTVSASGDVTVETEGLYYFGLKTSSTIETKSFNVYTLTLKDKVATAITTINSDDAKVRVYSLDGTLIKDSVYANEALQDLNAGVYIINRKKVLVK